VRDLLGGDECQRAVGGDLFREFQRRLQRLALVHHPVDQPDLGGPRGVDEVAGEQQLQRERPGYPLRQQQRAARARHQAALDLGDAEPGQRARHHQVAGEQQLESPGQRPALGRADQRLARRGLGDAAQPAAGEGRRLALEERLEVHARGERAARAGEHAHPQVFVCVQLVGRVADSGRDRPVQGVAGLRPVDDDDLHRAMALDQHLVAHPCFSALLAAALDIVR
jgi:hypothetical protein